MSVAERPVDNKRFVLGVDGGVLGYAATQQQGSGSAITSGLGTVSHRANGSPFSSDRDGLWQLGRQHDGSVYSMVGAASRSGPLGAGRSFGDT